MVFKTRNGIIKTGNGIISPTSRTLNKILLLQHLLHINQGAQNWFSKQEIELSKQEMELSKQEMELLLPLPGLLSKNFFYNIFFIFPKEFKIGFKNKKWNYLNRKWNYFSHFLASDQNFFYHIFSIFPKELKIRFQNRK